MNTLSIHDVIPVPLRDAISGSAVWNQKLDFVKGEKYLVMADSGKGKSTLLNILYGIRKDYSGAVLFDTRNIRELNSFDFSTIRQNELAYLFQDLRLFGQLTARENIMFKPGCTFTSAETEHYAEKLGMLKFLDRRCDTLSLGQQQRIALIRAISQKFDFIFLDEPVSHLDAKNASAVMEIVFERAGAYGAGILATSLGDTGSFTDFKQVQL